MELMKDSETDEQLRLITFKFLSLIITACFGSVLEIFDFRLKCGEFLLLVIGQTEWTIDQSIDTVQKKLRRLVGEKCSAMMWAAGRFGSTLGPEQRQVALSIQARRVLEALEKQADTMQL